MQDVVRNYVIHLIKKKAKLPSGDLDAFDYMESGHIDSMGIIKFILDIEAEFGIEITEVDMNHPKFKTIGGITDIILTKI